MKNKWKAIPDTRNFNNKKEPQEDWGKIMILSTLKKEWKKRPLRMNVIQDLKNQLYKWQDITQQHGFIQV